MWGSWFGGNSAQRRKDAPKKAILDLRQQLDMLQKRERHLENQMANEDKKARDNVSSNKTGRFGFSVSSGQRREGGADWGVGEKYVAVGAKHERQQLCKREGHHPVK